MTLLLFLLAQVKPGEVLWHTLGPPGSKKHLCICLSFKHVLMSIPTQQCSQIVWQLCQTIKNKCLWYFVETVKGLIQKRSLGEIQVPDLRNNTWLYFKGCIKGSSGHRFMLPEDPPAWPGSVVWHLLRSKKGMIFHLLCFCSYSPALPVLPGLSFHRAGGEVLPFPCSFFPVKPCG